MNAVYERDFPILYEEAECLADANPDSDQVIVVQSAKGNRYKFTNKVLSWEEESEDTFLKTLRDNDDCVLDLMVCMWTDCRGVEQPRWTLQKKLVQLDRRNEEMQILVQFEQGIGSTSLRRILPPGRYQND